MALAQRVERAEIELCAVGAGAGLPGGAAAIEVAGGMAVYGEPGAPVNKVLGLGVGCTVTDADLDAIELFYDERQCPIQIELCPLVSTELLAKLVARGYLLKGFENEIACAVPTSAPPGNGLRVDVAVGHHDEDIWLRVTSEGFATPDSVAVSAPPPADVLESIGTIARQWVHPDLRRYLAWVDGEPAGAGGSVIINGVLAIFGTATRPSYRRRGALAAIVARALQGAVGCADLAIATTEPGSTSQRTFERFGFQVLYTRAILVRS